MDQEINDVLLLEMFYQPSPTMKNKLVMTTQPNEIVLNV